MRIGATEAALEHAEEVFDVVCGETGLADVAALGVIDGLVSGKFLADVAVKHGIVGHEDRLAVYVLNQSIGDSAFKSIGDSAFYFLPRPLRGWAVACGQQRYR